MTIEYSPFSLDTQAEQAYQQWREWKLSVYPKQAEELLVPIENPYSLSTEETEKLRQCFIRANMAIYTIKYNSDFVDKKIVAELGSHFALHRLDGNLCADKMSISSIEVIDDGRRKGYIPYSNLKLSWHTDGYYNSSKDQIRGLILHCVNSADEGGENALLDHEMMYIHLRDENPAYISALMQNNVLTIPPNVEEGVEIRGVQSGPVFSIDKQTGMLHMRYSARKRNIIWTDNEITTKAVNAIDDFLAGDTPWIFRHRLKPGQGLICNNVLHNRSAFKNSEENSQQRLMYRGRYFDRIAKTSFNDILKEMSL